MAGLRKLNLQMANSQVTDFDDSLIVVGRNNTTDVDIGFLGRKPDNEYAGLVRDSDTANFILIETVVLENNQLNDVSALDSTLVKATLQVGTLEADNLTVGGTEMASQSYVDNAIANINTHTEIILPKGVNRPANPSEGQLFFNTTTKMFEGYDGTNWIVFVPATYTETA